MVHYHRSEHRFQQELQVSTWGVDANDNIMLLWTIGALALRTTGKIKGSFYFISLSTRCMITCNWATALPMPDDVIHQIHHKSQWQKANTGMLFADCYLILDEQDIKDAEDDDDEEDAILGVIEMMIQKVWERMMKMTSISMRKNSRIQMLGMTKSTLTA